MAAVRPAMLAAAAAPAGLARAPTLCCGLRVPGPWVTMRARGRAAPPPLDLAPAGAFEAPSGPRVTRRGSRRWRLLACVLCAAVVYGLLQSGGASSSELPLPASAPCAAAELGLAAGGLLGGKARPRNCGWAGGRGRRLDGELQPSLCAISDTLQRARPWLPALPDAAQRLCVTLQHAQKRVRAHVCSLAHPRGREAARTFTRVHAPRAVTAPRPSPYTSPSCTPGALRLAPPF